MTRHKRLRNFQSPIIYVNMTVLHVELRTKFKLHVTHNNFVLKYYIQNSYDDLVQNPTAGILLSEITHTYKSVHFIHNDHTLILTPRAKLFQKHYTTYIHYLAKIPRQGIRTVSNGY